MPVHIFILWLYASATTLLVEIAEQYSVEDVWVWAGRAEREAFVGEHRSELKKIIAKIERKKAVS